MNTYLERIDTVITHFKNKDTSLGFRLLLDCVLDTQDISFYKKAIHLAELQENADESSSGFMTKSMQLLEELKTIEIADRTQNKVLVSAKDITKKYNKFELGVINIDINEGDVWGLVGENGNGKTTLLRVLANELLHTKGEIVYNLGTGQIKDYELRTKLAYIPQVSAKCYGLVMDNLKFTASQYGIHGEENELIVLMYLARFGMWNYKSLKWSELSSGYKMRFELVRTLLRKPKILLLDEPLANLDVLTQQIVLEDLLNISKSLSHPLGVILSSQQLFEVEKISDKLLFLKNGIPRFLSTENSMEDGNTIHLELDSNSKKELIVQSLSGFEKVEISYNGGVFLITVENTSFNELLLKLLDKKVVITYIRDISKSTRRLFNA